MKIIKQHKNVEDNKDLDFKANIEFASMNDLHPYDYMKSTDIDGKVTWELCYLNESGKHNVIIYA